MGYVCTGQIPLMHLVYSVPPILVGNAPFPGDDVP